MSKKVLHIINDLDSGGAERMLYNLLKNFDDASENHAVISLHDKGLYGERIEALDVQLYQMNIDKRNKIKVFLELRKLVKKYDVIDTWLYQSDFIGAIINKTLIQKKHLIWNIRHANLDAEFNKGSTMKIVGINAKLSKKVSQITYNSHKAQHEHEKFGYSNMNAQVIPNGFEIEKFEFLESARNEIRNELSLGSTPTLITVGRWNIQKDYPTLLKALSLVKQHDDNFQMVMVGKDLDKNNHDLMSLISKYELTDNVKLLGIRKDVRELLSGSDVYISSSLGESFSNSIGEAMCSGLEIIATDVGDSKVIVGNSGTIVDAQSAEALAEAILNSIHDISAERNQTAVQIIEDNYSIAKVSKQFQELYR